MPAPLPSIHSVVRQGREAQRRSHLWREASTPPRAIAWACARSACCCRDGAPELPATTKPAHRTGQVDRRSRKSADRPRHGESHLGRTFRQRHRRHAQRFRPHGSAADASGVAGLSGQRIRGGRVQRQADTPPDSQQQHIPAVFRRASRSRRARRSPCGERIPANRLLWRFNRQRLEAEEIRDAMLSVSGQLNPKAGGPSVMVPIDKGLVNQLYKPSQWVPAKDPPNTAAAAFI